MRSRPRRDCTAEFPELTAIADALVGRHVILDGELVCLDHAGKPNFAALRARLGRRPGNRAARIAPAMLICFDVLHLDGCAVRQFAICGTAGAPREPEARGPGVASGPGTSPGRLTRCSPPRRSKGLEGVVAKRLDAAYREGRSRSWLKIKHRRCERLTVTGWRERDGELPRGPARRVRGSRRMHANRAKRVARPPDRRPPAAA